MLAKIATKEQKPTVICPSEMTYYSSLISETMYSISVFEAVLNKSLDKSNLYSKSLELINSGFKAH